MLKSSLILNNIILKKIVIDNYFTIHTLTST